MKKNIKSIFIILIIILAFISIMALIYGFINVNKDKANVISDEEYLKIVNESIEQCKGYSSVLDDPTDYDNTIKLYIQNIDDSKSAVLKTYESNTMVRYALSYFSEKSVDFETNLTSNGAVSPYTSILEELNNRKIQLTNLL